jgi:hypothetical protein
MPRRPVCGMTHCMANPIFDTAPHIVHGQLQSWITAPPGVVNRVTEGSRVTTQLALDMTIEVDRVMRSRWPRTKYVYVHDFSLGIGYDEDAIRIMVEWGRNSMSEVAAIIVIVGPETRAVDKVAAYAGRLALKIFSIPMEITEDIGEVIERYKLRPAAL